jgi:hypothetical protein
MQSADSAMKSMSLAETLPKTLSGEERQRAQMEICHQNMEIWNCVRNPDELSRIYERDVLGSFPLLGVCPAFCRCLNSILT